MDVGEKEIQVGVRLGGMVVTYHGVGWDRWIVEDGVGWVGWGWGGMEWNGCDLRNLRLLTSTYFYHADTSVTYCYFFSYLLLNGYFFYLR